MGKRVQTYAVVCVMIDCDTNEVVGMDLSDASEMPMDSGEVWDIDSGEWVSPEEPELVQDWADNAVAVALAAYKNATQAAQMVASWEVCGPPDQQELLDAAECLDEEGMRWKFPDGSILRVTHGGDHAEAVPAKPTDLIEAAKEALKCIEQHVPATTFAPRGWLRDAITKAEEA